MAPSDPSAIPGPGGALGAGPTTASGKMLRGLARRNNDEFRHWRTVIYSATADRLLGSILFQAFRDAVERRFAQDTDLRRIVEFLLVPRLALASEWRLPLLESEALIRSALGERGLVQGIDGVLVHEIRMQLLVHLVEDLALSAAELDELLVAAEESAVEDQATDVPRSN